MRRKKCMVMFTEGETEEKFYELVLNQLKIDYKINKFKVDALVKRCLKGISKFDKKLINKYKHEISTKYKDYDIIVFLCYDTDVFELNRKPRVDWFNIETELKSMGAKVIVHIKAEKCIEDFFLKDLEGIANYLKITMPKKILGKTAVEKLSIFFEKGNRIYQKGYPSLGFLESLDIKKIMSEYDEVFRPFVDYLVIGDK